MKSRCLNLANLFSLALLPVLIIGSGPDGAVAAASIRLPAPAALTSSDLSPIYGWSFEGNLNDVYLGWAVAAAGDVNGDGYMDFLASAPEYDDGTTYNEGRVFVFYGSASGPGAAPDWTAEGDLMGLMFGISVAGAGDVNGDGYDDIIIGTIEFSNDAEQGQEGAIFVYYGSANGLDPDGSRPVGTPANADWMAEANQRAAWLGQAVAAAGDVNGDGYDDIIVGAPTYDCDGLMPCGAIFVFHGSSGGLERGGARPSGDPSNADWWALGKSGSGSDTRYALNYGQAVGAAGDVNGDGYDDVIVGAPRYYLGGSLIYDEGAAYVYHGSATGLDAGGARPFGTIANADWWAHSDQYEAHFGEAVGAAGDVNGDGADEVIVGVRQYQDPAEDSDEGWVFVYYGHRGTGLSAAADWIAQSNQADAFFGTAVGAASDLNGDGYDDILVGAPAYDYPTGAGAAFAYYGSASGLGPNGTPENADWLGKLDTYFSHFGNALAAAGDVNGDTCPDVLVGARYFTGSRPSDETQEGGIFLFYGVCEPWDFGDAPDSYATLLASNGARHRLSSLYLGATVDGEVDGQPSVDALGDDNDSDGDDEDGVVVVSPLVALGAGSVDVTVSAAGYLNAWIDFHQVGNWNLPDGRVFMDRPLTPGVNRLMIVVPSTAALGQTYARFRVSTVRGLSPSGPAPDGEVEDYRVEIVPAPTYTPTETSTPTETPTETPTLTETPTETPTESPTPSPTPRPADWGDAPDPGYPTWLVSNGARHTILSGFCLGDALDPEPDGQPKHTADGDDNDADGNDDDGITFLDPLVPGNPQVCLHTKLTNTAGIGLPRLDAWMDFDSDGSWAHPGEHLWGGASQRLEAGANVLCFAVPATARAGGTYARFRLSDNGGLLPTSLWPLGEVEDYYVEIVTLHTPTPTATVTLTPTPTRWLRFRHYLPLILRAGGQ